MVVYLIRNKVNGRYYCRKASAPKWTSESRAVEVFGDLCDADDLCEMIPEECEVVPFILTETTMEHIGA